MEKIEFRKKYKEQIVIALGMFDCVHLAHTRIIDRVCAISKEKNCLPAVFTFSDIGHKSFKKDQKSVYTFSERLDRFFEQKIEIVIFKRASRRFLNLPPEKFLNNLLKYYNISGIVCGEDYKFGKGALGDVSMLKNFCLNTNIGLEIIDTVKIDGQKVSTSLVKKLLNSGDIEKANILLGSPYFIKGIVVKGAGRGKDFLYPTANIMQDDKKVKIKDGVYFTKTKIGDKTYDSLTNCGSRPSVDENINFFETHILNFDGNLYNKEIKIYFYKRIRDTKKFENLEDLKKQISKDIKFVKGFKN